MKTPKWINGKILSLRGTDERLGGGGHGWFLVMSPSPQQPLPRLAAQFLTLQTLSDPKTLQTGPPSVHWSPLLLSRFPRPSALTGIVLALKQDRTLFLCHIKGEGQWVFSTGRAALRPPSLQGCRLLPNSSLGVTLTLHEPQIHSYPGSAWKRC